MVFLYGRKALLLLFRERRAPAGLGRGIVQQDGEGLSHLTTPRENLTTLAAWQAPCTKIRLLQLLQTHMCAAHVARLCANPPSSACTHTHTKQIALLSPSSASK